MFTTWTIMFLIANSAYIINIKVLPHWPVLFPFIFPPFFLPFLWAYRQILHTLVKLLHPWKPCGSQKHSTASTSTCLLSHIFQLFLYQFNFNKTKLLQAFPFLFIEIILWHCIKHWGSCTIIWGDCKCWIGEGCSRKGLWAIFTLFWRN